MVETTWAPRTAWAGVAEPGHFGIDDTGVTVALCRDPSIATLMCDHAGADKLAGAVKTALGIALPQAGRVATADRCTLIWTAPEQWMLIAPAQDYNAALPALSSAAAVADQTGGRAILRVSGPRVRDVLAKGVMLDLDAAQFAVGSAASTSIAHVPATLWRGDDEGGDAVFFLSVPRSMAGTFWAWFTASAAEFGCDIAA